MPKLFIEYLEGNNLFVCKHCHTHLVKLSDLISRAYRSQHGTAFLFDNVYHLNYLELMLSWANTSGEK